MPRTFGWSLCVLLMQAVRRCADTAQCPRVPVTGPGPSECWAWLKGVQRMVTPVVTAAFSAHGNASEPEDDFVATEDESTARTALAIIPVKLDVGGDEPLTIVNFQEELPEPTSARTRGIFVRA